MKETAISGQNLPADTTTPEEIGEFASKFPVELSTRFLEHFSEQLYSSPQKAFEELISNGWDAGADFVDVRVSEDLDHPGATMCVLDNGESMDAEGLQQLWHIAFSPKQNKQFQYGRKVIGKFGIGKLATYVLANKLTYICKASDGVIRRVTMDYSGIDRQAGEDKLISQLELKIYNARDSEVELALGSVYAGDVVLKLIKDGVQAPTDSVSEEDEFGSARTKFEPPSSGTWTLVVLSDLKRTGRELKIGILRRMLQAALPFGTEMAIALNGERLTPSKISAPTICDWVIGPELKIDCVELVGNDVDGENPDGAGQDEVVRLKSGNSPKPYIEIPGIGRVTGRVRLFEDRISGGKSEERGTSNGFHVNVLGRIVNQNDPSFGEDNLSHAAWAKFRMTVRADGLNQFLTTSREQFRERRELKVFRAFLRKAFNRARTYYDSDQQVAMPDGGDVLVRSLGVLSLSPLRSVVSETLNSQSPLPGLFDESGVDDRAAARKAWKESTGEDISNALKQIRYERVQDDSFVKFRLSDNSIIVNKEHPFVLEHSRSKAEKALVRTVAMVNLLTDVYAIDVGVQASTLESIRGYRDQLMRFHALQQRRSGAHIAKMLLKAQHDEDYRKLEAVLSDALRYLGFHVKDLAKSGEPEGIASAYPIPTNVKPTAENPNPPLYSFSFDAKSSKHEASKTGNIDLAAIVDHRDRYKANYALVVAPGFTGKAIRDRCAQQRVTPIAAPDLGRLLEYTVEFGAIPLTKLQEIFGLYDAEEVSDWVNKLKPWLTETRPLTIDVFLSALRHLRGRVPDVLLPAGTIAFECREHLKAITVRDKDVIALVGGLAILVPDLIGINGDKVVVNASADRVAAAIEAQMEKLRRPSNADEATGEDH